MLSERVKFWPLENLQRNVPCHSRPWRYYKRWSGSPKLCSAGKSWVMILGELFGVSRSGGFPQTSEISTHLGQCESSNVAVVILFVLIAANSNCEHHLSPRTSRINTDYQRCVIVDPEGSGKSWHCSPMSLSPDSSLSHRRRKNVALMR